MTLDSARTSPQELDQLQAIFKRYAGPTRVCLTFRLPAHLEIRTSGLPNLGVLPSTEFLEEIEQLLGADSVALQ